MKLSERGADDVAIHGELAALRARVAELEALVREWKDAAHENLKFYGRWETLRAVAEAADWVRHLAHGVGKAGDQPEPGEWEDAVNQLDVTIAAAKEARAL